MQRVVPKCETAGNATGPNTHMEIKTKVRGCQIDKNDAIRMNIVIYIWS